MNKKTNPKIDAFIDFFNGLKVTKKALFIILGIITGLTVFISIYFGLTPFNFNNGGFRFLIGFLLAIWSVPFLFRNKIEKNYKPLKKTKWLIPTAILGLFMFINLTVSIVTSPLFMAKEYRNLINVVDNHSFTDDVENYTTMQIPVVDKALAEKLGDKKLGEDNLGSQYNVGEYYMICHNDNLYWIAPIEFNGFFPWASQRVSPGYVTVNANNPADVVIHKKPLKYTDSAYFSEDLGRRNYFNNMGAWRADDAHLELTDEGEPRFVETVYTNKIGYINGKDVLGIIVTNPSTGKSEYYDYLDAPTWINHVLTEEVVVEQLNYWGQYVNGFFNSMFAKSEVLAVSTGINYVYSNGNMYLQTGMTSVGSDESIVGVMMVDMRTKESFFYRIGGATEWAAAQSAIGKDQEMRYTASDPIMINLDGTPTYFLMLKDDEGLVKRYAYVNVKDYRLVSTGETKTEALISYKKLINIDSESQAETYTIADIVPVTTGGETFYYIRFVATSSTPDGFETFVFRASVELNPSLPFLKAGDEISIRYEQSGSLYEISTLEVV